MQKIFGLKKFTGPKLINQQHKCNTWATKWKLETPQ